MTNLKLGKLPDRTPAKITITVSSDLNQALQDYAEIYRAVHGQKESVAELIPFMLEGFIENDTGFKKARRELRARHPETRPASRSRLDQPTRHFHNRRNESVNRNRRCLNVVDRFRTE